jgi:hypothetical protein
MNNQASTASKNLLNINYYKSDAQDKMRHNLSALEEKVLPKIHVNG